MSGTTAATAGPRYNYGLASTSILVPEAAKSVPSAPLRRLNLLLVDLPPFLALGEDVIFRFLERLINPFALDEIAGLAGGHQVVHVPRAAFGVRMDVVDGQDQPAFEIVLSVETTVVTFELISPENLHRVFATQVG